MTDKPKTKEDHRRDVAVKRFEELGASSVTTLLTSGGLPNEWHLFAHEWLAAKDKAK